MCSQTALTNNQEWYSIDCIIMHNSCSCTLTLHAAAYLHCFPTLISLQATFSLKMVCHTYNLYAHFSTVHMLSAVEPNSPLSTDYSSNQFVAWKVVQSACQWVSIECSNDKSPPISMLWYLRYAVKVKIENVYTVKPLNIR